LLSYKDFDIKNLLSNINIKFGDKVCFLVEITKRLGELKYMLDLLINTFNYQNQSEISEIPIARAIHAFTIKSSIVLGGRLVGG
jgi:hypothetical protein